MEYITTVGAVGYLGVTIRQVQRFLAAKRIPDAKKYGRSWLIPAHAKKPHDMRHNKCRGNFGYLNWDGLKPPEQKLLSDLHEIHVATTLPMSRNNPDAVLDTVD